MDNQHKLIKGYRDLSQQEIDAVNSIKLAEQDIGQLWQQIKKDVPDVDLRALSLAKTGLQEAFHWFIRAVAKPLDVFELELPTPAPETYLDRLRAERDDLNEKYQKLGIFINSVGFGKLDKTSQEDLRIQYEVMAPYALIINKRYDDLTPKAGE